ncbi:MAG: lysophospholipase [Anaerolineae bacterium]|nr:lysophospholipase [Anaerolineae bacterium]
MKHEEGFFQGVRGTRIFHQRWLPDGEPKAALLIVHGLGEHSGRYTNVVNHLVPLGYALYGLDHLGHGKSEGTREFVERFEDYTDTLDIYRGMVSQAQPGKPLILYGHSLGGLIATTYLLDHQAGLAGAVLSAPLSRVPENVSAMTITMGRLLSRLAPKVGVLPLDAAAVSRDPAVVQAYIDDPLVFHGKTPARLAAEMMRAMQRVMAEAGKITLPVMIFQGSADRLDPGDGEFLYNSVGSADKTLKVYEGLYHETHNEPERATVLHDVEEWLGAHV